MRPGVTRARILPKLLAVRAAEGATGVLEATRGKVRRLFCLEKGWITFATSNILEEQIAEYLVRHGALKPAHRVEAVEQSSKQRRTLTEILLERGAVTREVLARHMEGLVEELLGSCLEWADGNAVFKGGRPRIDDAITVRLSPVQLILRHAKRYPADVNAVRVRIGPPDFRPERSSPAVKMIESMHLDIAGQFVMDRCDGSLTVAELVATSPAGEEPTLRALHAFLLIGLLEPARRTVAMAETARVVEAPLTREECLTRLAGSEGADHYAVLALNRKASRDSIRDNYYALARRFHPDRFRSGVLQDLLPLFEAFFTHVTEAYNTLWYPDRRSEYDQQIAVPAVDPGSARQSEPSYLARQNFLRAKELLERKRFIDATTFLENAVRLDGSQAEYHLELGLVLVRNPRRREDAARHLTRATEINPSAVAGYLALAKLYRRAGRNAEATSLFRSVLQWDPGHVEATLQLGEMGETAHEVSGEGRTFRGFFKG